METASPYFGIDLGTTYSCIAKISPTGEAEVIPNRDNLPTTASVVFFEEDGSPIVGQYALRAADQAPERLVTEVKRSMGVDGEKYTILGQEYTPQAISAIILKQVILDAEQALRTEIHDVVITCPAYFGLAQKEATRQAGELAGKALQAERGSGQGVAVHHILQEPLAAALHYGVKETPPEKPELLMVYDLGGGTFDVTLIRWSEHGIEELVTEGNRRLGGKDWDRELTSHIKDRFCEETSCAREELDASNEVAYDLLVRSEDAKKELSAMSKTRVRLIHGTIKSAVDVTRETFDAISAHLLEESIVCTHRALKTAVELEKIAKGQQPSRLLLVGGSSKMPQVRARLEKEFPGVSIQFNDPDEAVAKGAARFAQVLQLKNLVIEFTQGRKTEMASLTKSEQTAVAAELSRQTGVEMDPAAMAVMLTRSKVMTSASHSFGLRALDNDKKLQIFHLIKKGDTLPAETQKLFATSQPGQQAVELPVFETDSLEEFVSPDYEHANQIGRAVMADLPPNTPVQTPIEVNFVLNEQGMLDVTARELKSGRTVSASIQTGTTLSKAEMEKETALISAAAKHPPAA